MKLSTWVVFITRYKNRYNDWFVLSKKELVWDRESYSLISFIKDIIKEYKKYPWF